MPEPEDTNPPKPGTEGNPVTANQLNEAIGRLENAFTQGIQTINERFASIEDEISGQRVDWNNPQPQNNPPPGEADANAEMRVKLLDTPVDALTKFYEEKTKPLVGLLLEGRRDTERLRAERRYPDWQQYEAEITALEKSVNPAALANPGAYDALYKIAKGGKFDDAIAEAKKAGKKEVTDGLKTFSEGPGGGPKPPPDPETVTLDPAEEAIRRQFGFEKSEWLRHKDVLIPAAKAKKEGA